MNGYLKGLLGASLAAAGLTFGTAAEAEAGGYGYAGSSYGYGSSYRSYPSHGYHGGHSHRSHYTPRRVWHDTSHYDYHPGVVVPHGNHYHYIPGHYDWHQDGHWDRYGRGHGGHGHDHHGH